jgi:hypothetical protein
MIYILYFTFVIDKRGVVDVIDDYDPLSRRKHSRRRNKWQ